MDSKFKRQIVADSETIEQLAQKICGYGYFDEYDTGNGCSYPVPIEAVKEYLRIGVMFAKNGRR